nr:hypothetical protein Iba_chr04fCG12200 [Ipomoea batatas]
MENLASITDMIDEFEESEPKEELAMPKTKMASEDKSLQRSQEAQSVGGAKKKKSESAGIDTDDNDEDAAAAMIEQAEGDEAAAEQAWLFCTNLSISLLALLFVLDILCYADGDEG